MYEATDLDTRKVYRYRSLDEVVRRLGGTKYQIEHSEAFRPPTLHVLILKWVPQTDSYSVVATVIVDTDDIEEMERASIEADGAPTD